MMKKILILTALVSMLALGNCTQYIYGPIAKGDDGYFYIGRMGSDTSMDFLRFKKEGNKLIQQ